MSVSAFLKRIFTKPVGRRPGEIVSVTKISDYATQFHDPITENKWVMPEAKFILPVVQKKSVKQSILEFLNAHPVGTQFTANELRRYVNVYATPAPGSTDRILRDLRNRAVIGYVIVDRQKSLYEVTPAKVSLPDSTGDNTPYFERAANDPDLVSLDEVLEQEEAWADGEADEYDQY